MRKAPLYSRSTRHPAGGGAGDAATVEPAAPPSGTRQRLRARIGHHPGLAWAFGGALLAALATAFVLGTQPGARVITQDDIDAAVRASLEKEPLPSAAARAAAAIAPSVVRVVGLADEDEDENGDSDENAERKAMERALGSGVLIIDNGTILTNLHVLAGSRRIRVRFWNGLESDADIVSSQP